MSILVKAPERIRAICGDIAKHFEEKVAPNGFGAQVVTFDRESCLLYKQELDRHLPPEVSDVVISVNSGEPEYAAFKRDRDAEEKLLDRFREPPVTTCPECHRESWVNGEGCVLCPGADLTCSMCGEEFNPDDFNYDAGMCSYCAWRMDKVMRE